MPLSKYLFYSALFVTIILATNVTQAQVKLQSPSSQIEQRQKEPRLRNIRQLTFGGDNAEAYFSFDQKMLSFQKRNPLWEVPCDQIYVMDIEKATNAPSYTPPMVSTGLGRTTCAYFMPDDKHVLYASTHEGNVECPPEPAPRADQKYVWPLYNTFNIYVADMQGNIVKKLTDRVGYDAEATVSPQGDKIVFTSDRSGDLELWTMDIDGNNLKQITFDLGYDGGAFFSSDGKRLVYRSSRPKTDSAIAEYKSLLAQGVVTPTEMEIYTCNVDGTKIKQVTRLGKANWAPYFHPTSGKIIFASNHASDRGYSFQLYMVDEDGNGLEQITAESIFNAFAVFSADGKRLVWSSNRDNNGTRDTNVFIADFD